MQEFPQPLMAGVERKPLNVAQGYGKNLGIPSSVDWRTKEGVVQPVIDMGQMHDSKSISVTRSIEARLAIDYNVYAFLSIIEVENCCRGMGNIYQCIVDIGGVAEYYDYPQNSTVCQSKAVKPSVKIGGGFYIPRDQELEMAKALVKHPIVIGLDASKASFMMYTEGVYRDSQCSQEKINHYMLVVGYGNYDGVDYWLCQNSWGE